METTVAIIAIILCLLGIIGSILPGLPGPPLNWLGLLFVYLWCNGTDAAGEPMTRHFLLIWLAVTVAVTVLDYLVPAYFTKLTGGSKAGGWGAIIGLFAGIFIPPIGMIVGSLLGAFIAELIFAQKDTATSLKSAMGAFLGFLFGTGIKLISAGMMLYYVVVYGF